MKVEKEVVGREWAETLPHIHLQWFADAPAVTVEDGPDESEDDGAQPSAPEAIYEADDLAVFESEEEPGEDPREVRKHLAEIQAQLKAEQEKSNTANALKEAVLGLGASLRPQAAPVDPRVQVQGIPDPEAYLAKINEKFFDNPAAAILELQGKVQEMNQANLVNQNLAISKRLVTSDPENKKLYARWGSEVDSIVAGMPPQAKAMDPDPYLTALNIVKAHHFDDLWQEKLAELEGGNGKPKLAPKPANYAEGSAIRGAPASVPRVREEIQLSPSQKSAIQKFADDNAMSFEGALRVARLRGAIGRK